MNPRHRVMQALRSASAHEQALWLSAHAFRAACEGLFIGCVGAWIGALMTSDDHTFSFTRVSKFGVLAFIYWGLFTILWCALRARFTGNWWQGIGIDLLTGFGLAMLPTTLFLLYQYRLVGAASINIIPMSIVYSACIIIGYPSLHGLLRLASIKSAFLSQGKMRSPNCSLILIAWRVTSNGMSKHCGTSGIRWRHCCRTDVSSSPAWDMNCGPPSQP
jgi:hypothetical protein